MALELSAKAELLSQQTNIQQMIILEVDDIPLVFGSLIVTKLVKYGDDLKYGDEGLVYGGVIKDPSQRDYIMLSGTTNNLTQQVKPDEGATSSVQKFSIKMVDKNEELSRIFSPSFVVEDPISKKANIYVNFAGGSHPEDSTRIISGFVDSIEFGAGNVKIVVSHPEDLKRTEVFPLLTDVLPSDINNSVTTIPAEDTTEFLTPEDSIRTYIRIDDELMEYTGKTSNSFTGVSRGQLNTPANPHTTDTEIQSFIRLTGGPLDLALKLMLSGGDEYYRTDVAAPQFNIITPALNVQNAIFFPQTQFADRYGLTVGDLIKIDGATEAANNVIDRTIIAFVEVPTGTYVVVNGANLENETESSAVASFKSKYNIFTQVGAGLSPEEVDVVQHELLETTFSSSFPDYDFYLKDTINLKEFIDKELFYPAGLYLLSRKGRISVNYTVPPLAFNFVPEIKDQNSTNASQLKIRRALTDDFYNAISYSFSEDSIEDRLLARRLTFSARSANRIKTRNKPLKIESKGLRRNDTTDNFIDRQSRRFLDRYQFSAEAVNNVEIDYKTGLKIEAGDICIYGEDLQLTDTGEGTREFAPRLMEVVNKSINLKTGKVKLNILDSAYQIDARYGVVSPASTITSESTLDRLILAPSFATTEFELERNKWEQYIGQKILLHNEDYSVSEEGNLDGFDPTRTDALLISGFTISITDDLIIDAPNYPFNDDSKDQFVWKNLHVFQNPEIDVVSGISNTQFTINGADLNRVQVGDLVRVHNEDYSIDSTPSVEFDDAEIIDITGTTITVDRDLGFTPDNTMTFSLVRFPDDGLPYRYV